MGTPADRLAELLQFGPRKNKNAGGGSAYPPRSGGAKLPGGLIGFAIAAILILWLIASSYYTVQPEERAVVKRFGAVVKTADPGLHFKLPVRRRHGRIRGDRARAQAGVRLPHRCRPTASAANTPPRISRTSR
jgi:hypothetical protein